MSKFKQSNFRLVNEFRLQVSPQCPFCDKRFRNEVSLKKHFVKKHPETVDFVQCLRCFKAVKTKNELSAHECDLVISFMENWDFKQTCRKLMNFVNY